MVGASLASSAVEGFDFVHRETVRFRDVDGRQRWVFDGAPIGGVGAASVIGADMVFNRGRPNEVVVGLPIATIGTSDHVPPTGRKRTAALAWSCPSAKSSASTSTGSPTVAFVG